MNSFDKSVSNWENVLNSATIKEVDGKRMLLGVHTTFMLRSNPRQLLFMLSRYKSTARLLPHNCDSVLELGCNEGLGTMLLSQYAKHVTGVDSDSRAIAEAIEKDTRITFINSNFLQQVYGSFQAVISLDVIEHIPADIEHVFMKTVFDNLQDTGTAVIGTPNVAASAFASKESQMAHINLYDADRLRSLMETYFRHVVIFGMNDEVLHTGFHPMCHYLLAVGYGKKNV